MTAQTIDQLALLMTWALVPVGLAVVVLHVRMLRVLRTDHEDVWESLGRPRLWFADTVAETLKTERFLWRRAYLELKDTRLTVLCRCVWTLQIAFAVLFVLAGILLSVQAIGELGLAT